LLAALLCWLDARSRGAELLLRLEDVDHTRSTRARADALCAAFDWLGLDWDRVELQSAQRQRHQDALRALAERGRIYACECSRAEIRAAGLPAADGGWRYPGTCRTRSLAPDELADCRRSVRLRLDPGRIDLRDALQHLLGLPQPVYRHHLLLLEERGGKLAKLHGAVGADALRAAYTAPALLGFLAHAAGPAPDAAPTTPAALLAGFDWARVAREDRVVRWTGTALELGR
jgi:glutamyl-tRNA synthetase/glutamyl-Q tRNA(Asp) synthetase